MQLSARVPKLVIIVFTSLLVNSIIVFLILLFILQLIGPNNRVQDWDIAIVEDSQEFSPGQAITLNVDTVTVYVPPFAIPLPGSIFMIRRQGDTYPVSGQLEWNRPQVIDVQFRSVAGIVVPDIVLSAPMKICFQLTQAEWQHFVENPTSYSVQYYDFKSDSPSWLSVPITKNPDLFQLCGRTNQLSSFALAIQSDFTIPVTGPSVTPRVSATADPIATRTPTSPTYLQISTPERRSALDLLPSFILSPTLTLQPFATLTVTRHPTATPTRTPTNTPYPTATPTRTLWPTATPTRTLQPTATPTRTLRPTRTPTRTLQPTATETVTPPPTATNPPPTATNPPPTATNPPPTATNPPPTATNPPPPTATNPPPPTATNPPPPTATNPPPPTATNPPPPTATNPPPPTATDPPPPTATNPPPPEPTQPPAETPPP